MDVYRERRDLRAVVLDMVMPGMTGRATYAAMRAVDPEIPVLLMSGHAINEEIQSVLDQGASGFLSKPYSVEALARSLADVIRA
jgi:DNA-binding NtrC family response regulator